MNGLPDVTAELIALAAALGDQSPPCRDDADTWFEDPPAAIAGCRRCPALHPCRTYAASVQPTAGVWAGVDHERRGRRHQLSEAAS